jgi:hypothetical protein
VTNDAAVLFAAVHEALVGTNQTTSDVRSTVAYGRRRQAPIRIGDFFAF